MSLGGNCGFEGPAYPRWVLELPIRDFTSQPFYERRSASLGPGPSPQERRPGRRRLSPARNRSRAKMVLMQLTASIISDPDQYLAGRCRASSRTSGGRFKDSSPTLKGVVRYDNIDPPHLLDKRSAA